MPCSRPTAAAVATLLLLAGSPANAIYYFECEGEVMQMGAYYEKESAKFFSHIIDVRSKAEYESGHVPGAHYFAGLASDPDKAEELMCMKLSHVAVFAGKEGYAAAGHLKKAGFNCAIPINGTMEEYTSLGGRLVAAPMKDGVVAPCEGKTEPDVGIMEMARAMPTETGGMTGGSDSSPAATGGGSMTGDSSSGGVAMTGKDDDDSMNTTKAEDGHDDHDAKAKEGAAPPAPEAASSYIRVMFDTEAEALAAAARYNCTGAHQMGKDWMVGATHGGCDPNKVPTTPPAPAAVDPTDDHDGHDHSTDDHTPPPPPLAVGATPPAGTTKDDASSAAALTRTTLGLLGGALALLALC